MYKPPASAAVRKDSITHVWPLFVERWVFKLRITFERLFASLERLVSVLLTALQPLKRVTIPSFSPAKPISFAAHTDHQGPLGSQP